MKLYLVQHGESKTEKEDPKKPLSDQGKENVSHSTELASRLGVSPAEVLHSGKLRAQESAEILAKRLNAAIRREKDLDPNDPVAPWKDRLADETRDLMLVGHLPFMERLSSLLLTGSSEGTAVKFRMGGVVCLERVEGRWQLLWALWPEMAAATVKAAS